MKNLFTDIVEDVSFETIADTEGKKFLQVSGIAKRADFINKNKRYYSSSVLTKAVDEIQDTVKSGGLLGLIRHPDAWQGEPAGGHVQMTAVKWTDITMDDKDVRVKGIVVKTAAGSDLEALVDAGVKIGLSTNVKGAVKYVKAKDVDKTYPDQEVAIQVFDIVEFNTIDVVNTPADHFAALDSVEEAFSEMKLSELKDKSPELYEDLLKEAEAVVAAAVNAEDTDKADLEQEIVTLKTENDQLKKDKLEHQREAMIDRLLTEAKMPSLGVQGKIDLDTRFRVRLSKASLNAEDDEKAEEAIRDLVEEQKALLRVGGDPEDVNNPGIRRREGKNAADQEKRPVFNSVRASVGL